MSNYGESDQAPAARFNIQRRDFVKMALGGAALLASPGRSPAKLNPLAPGIKIGTYAQNPTEEHMFYLRELGVQWITSGDITPETANVEGFAKMREQWERGGLKVYNEFSRVAPSGNPVLNVPEIVLNLPGRDERIEEFATYIRDLSKAGIYYMTYGFEGTGNWRSGIATLPRGYTASDCNLASPDLFGGLGQLKKVKQQPLAFGRVFSREEIWDNYTYFIKKITPVAEECGFRIGIHPDDPPAPMLSGVPRIFSNFEDYKRAMEIAISPNIGVCLCCGTWLEGGAKMGADPAKVIRYFVPKGKLFKIHFRNVSSPLPHFTETLMDDGYYNMYKIMEALVEVNFDGLVIPDHVPELGLPRDEAKNREVETASVSGAEGVFRPSPGLAYSIGYINATLKAVQANKRMT